MKESSRKRASLAVIFFGMWIAASALVSGCAQKTYTREELDGKNAVAFDGVVVSKGKGYFIAADRVGMTSKFYVSRFDTQYLPDGLSLANLREGDDIRMHYVDMNDKFDKTNYSVLRIQATKTVPDDFRDKTAAIGKYHGDRALDPVEGIWAVSNSKYEVLIAKDLRDEFPEYDYVGYVLSAESASWRAGQVKVLLKSSAKKNIYPAKYILDDHSGAATTFVMDDCNIIEGSVPAAQPGKEREEQFLRLSPQPVGGVTRGSASGTAFMVSGKHAVTNYHVVEGQNRVKLKFYDGRSVAAHVDAHDRFNDLALLALEDGEGVPPPLPIADGVCSVGQKVFAFGFPMPAIMGNEAKFTDGAINSLSGIESDPRLYQVSAPIQAGNSGGPLLNYDGEVVGVMTASLNAVNLFVKTGDIPQNVNYAVKSSYVRSLLDSRPDRIAPIVNSLKTTTDDRMISEVKKSVALVVVGE